MQSSFSSPLDRTVNHLGLIDDAQRIVRIGQKEKVYTQFFLDPATLMSKTDTSVQVCTLKFLTDWASMYAKSNSCAVGPSAGFAMCTAKGTQPAITWSGTIK